MSLYMLNFFPNFFLLFEICFIHTRCICTHDQFWFSAPVRNFQLPRDTKTYDGTTKPEDWLADYVTAVYIAGGGVNRRWAVRIIPSYLVGPARIWLNNLPAGSINGWLDFEEAFVNNFSSTYKRPNRPQQLALCQQRAGE